jgi:hypothetical protein
LPGNPYDASPSSATSRNITAWGRNHLAHASGDAINPVLAAMGYNFRRLLAWLRILLSEP